jgi:aminopeptidase-like protein
MMNDIYRILDLYLENRTIVSNGSHKIVKLLSDFFPEASVERYPSGSHKCGWEIPPNWELVSASLYNLTTNELVLSHENSSLFIAPYSKSACLELSKNQLADITIMSESQGDAFYYQHRLAYDFMKRLKQVSISIPKNIFNELRSDHKFQLLIETKTVPGHLEIFNYSLTGVSKFRVYFLSHYCHTGQVNDGLAGVIVGARVMEYLQSLSPNLNYSYSFLSFPETIGSSIFVSEHEKDIEKGMFAIFHEMPGSNSSIRVTNSRRGSTYIDRITNFVLAEGKYDFTQVSFRNGWGNDEMVFDASTVGIPSVSIDRAPFDYYHTSNDNLENFNPDKSEEIVEVVIKIITLIEKDFIPVANFKAPPYLSKLGVYKDWTYNRIENEYIAKLLDILDQGKSVFDIAILTGVPFNFTSEFYSRLFDYGMIEKQVINPEYTRITF